MIENLLTWNYQGKEIRTVELNNEPWWVLADVCKVLGINHVSDVLKRLDEDEVDSTEVIDSLGRVQKASIVNEYGLYEVIIRSDKPAARPFRRWVTHEVLPAIRQNGVYEMPQSDKSEREYMKAARLLATCTNDSLPLVIYALRKGGLEIPDLEKEPPAPVDERADLGKKITEILEKYNLSYKRLAAELGVAGITLSRYVKGKRIPKKTTYNYLMACLEKLDIRWQREGIHRY